MTSKRITPHLRRNLLFIQNARFTTFENLKDRQRLRTNGMGTLLRESTPRLPRLMFIPTKFTSNQLKHTTHAILRKKDGY